MTTPAAKNVSLHSAAAYLTLGVGVVLSLAAWKFTANRIDHDQMFELNDRSHQARSAIERRVQEQVSELHRLQGALAAAAPVGRQTLRRLLQASDPSRTHPALTALQFARHVAHAQKGNFVAALPGDRGSEIPGQAQFSIKPEGERPQYLAIEYIEPRRGNEAGLGVDLLAFPNARDAALRARDSGETAATAPFARAAGGGEVKFALYLPVYQRGMEQLGERPRQALAGMLGAEVSMIELLQPLMMLPSFQHLRTSIHDLGVSAAADAFLPATPQNMLFDSGPARTDGAAPSLSDPGRFSDTARIDVGGRTWELTFVPTAGFASPLQTLLPWLVLLCGAVVSLVLFGVAWTFATARDRAQALAARMTEDLRESEARARAVAEMLPIPLILVRLADSRIVSINRRAAELFATLEQAAIGTLVLDYCETPAQCKRLVTNVHREGYVRDFEMRLKAVTGSQVWVTLSAQMTMHQGEAVMLIAMNDISARKRIEEALKASEEKFRLIAETVGDMIALLDSSGRRLYNNPSYARILGDVHLLAGTDSFHEIHPEDRARVRKVFDDTVATGIGHRTQYRFLLGDDSVRYIESEGSAIRNAAGEVERVVVVSRDITEAKLAEARIRHLAHHDFLTGLPNRTLLDDRLRQAIVQAHRNDRRVGVLFLDLDRFKTINDTLGHQIGDRLLQIVAERLLKCVRKVDTVARLGGDEFVIVLPAVNDARDLEQVARKVIESIPQPMVIDGRELRVTTSVGACLYPNQAGDAGGVLRNADAAMYQAKQAGRNSYRMFEPEPQESHTL